MSTQSKPLWFFVFLGLMVTIVNLSFHIRRERSAGSPIDFVLSTSTPSGVATHAPSPPPPVLHVVTAQAQKKHRHKAHKGHHSHKASHGSSSRESDMIHKRHVFTLNDNATDEAGHSLYSSAKFGRALHNYDENTKLLLGEEIEQSSRKFSDIIENPDHGILLPTSIASLRKIAEFERSRDENGTLGIVEVDEMEAEESDDAANDAAACNPVDSGFTEERDAKCQKYLSDIHNWLSIKAMSSVLSTGRTIKFKVYFRHNGLSGIMKVSQKKFALEPSSEVIAFHVDRMLKLYRVPPVVWVPFPVSFLQAASGVMTPFYAQWFRRFVLEYESNRPLLHRSEWQYGLLCINVSIQLWMHDVHDRDETLLNPPHHFGLYLTPKETSNDGDADLSSSAIDWSTQPQLVNLTLKELVSEFAFDYIIGNTDRWFGHNSFVFGGCIPPKDDPQFHSDDDRERFYGPRGKWPKPRCRPPPEALQTKSSLKYAFIDQGSSFYKQHPPEENAFSKENSANFCRFPRVLASEILFYSHGEKNEFYHVLKKRLPAGIFNLASSTMVKSAGTRLAALATRVQSCIDRYGNNEVFFFE